MLLILFSYKYIVNISMVGNCLQYCNSLSSAILFYGYTNLIKQSPIVRNLVLFPPCCYLK